jgi:hypothetical protein
MKPHSTRSRPWRCIRLALATLLLGGCDSPLAPADVAGTYVLVAYAGVPLPQTLPAHDITHVIVADTLVLRANGGGDWIQVRDLSHAAAPAPTRVYYPMPVRLRRAADALVLDENYPCADVDCAPPRSFRLRPVGEFLHLGAAPQVWSFRRVAP